MKIDYENVDVRFEIPPIQPKNSYIVFDVELFGAEKHLLHRPTGKFACISVTVDENTCYLLTDEKQLAPTLENCKDSIWVASNLPFDLRQMRRWAEIKPRKKVYCIETIERILFANYYSLFSVANTARRYCGIVLDKDPVKDFYEATELNDRLIEYAVTDGIVEYRILQEQLKEIQKNPWAFKIWMEVDMPALWSYLDFYGFRVDTDKWYKMGDEAKEKYESVKDTFPFNPNSSKAQVQPWFRRHGVKNIQSADIKTMSKLSEHDNPVVAEMAGRLLVYAKMKKPATTYGRSFIEPYLEEVDGVQVIYPDYNLSRAITGRESSRLHNIPIRDNPEYREPFIARPHNKLIVADYSSCEPRICGYLTQDENLIAAFNSGKDIYVKTAELLYDEQIEKSNPLRDRMKTAFLAATYGQTTRGMAEKENISVEEAEELQNRFFATFPKVKEWIDKQRSKHSYVETVMGRRLHMNPYREGDNERNALNAPHQGTAADIMKLAISKMYFNWKFDCPFGMVHQNHDEVILDVPEKLAPEIAEYVEYWMVKVAEDICPGIPFVAKAKICDNWLEGK